MAGLGLALEVFVGVSAWLLFVTALAALLLGDLPEDDGHG